MVSVMDTIYAPATAKGRAAVAIIRVSGALADRTLERLVGGLPPERRAVVRWVRHPETADAIDQCLVLRFAARASFTGEASFELQCHGGPAVVQALMTVLGREPGLRLAQPGEFTRRAFEAGRLDLTAAEALADLAMAETEAQRRQAVRSMQGALAEAVASWRAALLQVRAHLEAAIDFADEDVPQDGDGVCVVLDRVIADLTNALAGSEAAERVREGFEVALIGAPNAGKSSLLNALVKREAALTSPIAGTTRDVIDVRMDLGGIPVSLLDTAGLRVSDDAVEVMGVDLARRRAAGADLRVLLLAPGDERECDVALSMDDIVISSKADLGRRSGVLAVSTLTGEGLTELVNEIVQRLAGRTAEAGIVVRLRQRACLVDGFEHLARARKFVSSESELEIAAEEVRLALVAMDAVVGRIDVEDVLGEVFATFCLGK